MRLPQEPPPGDSRAAARAYGDSGAHPGSGMEPSSNTTFPKQSAHAEDSTENESATKSHLDRVATISQLDDLLCFCNAMSKKE